MLCVLLCIWLSRPITHSGTRAVSLWCRWQPARVGHCREEHSARSGRQLCCVCRHTCHGPAGQTENDLEFYCICMRLLIIDRMFFSSASGTLLREKVRLLLVSTATSCILYCPVLPIFERVFIVFCLNCQWFWAVYHRVLVGWLTTPAITESIISLLVYIKGVVTILKHFGLMKIQLGSKHYPLK